MTEEDTGIVMTIHFHHLRHSNKATVATTPLTLVGVAATNTMVTFTEAVTMAAAVLGDMVDEELPNQPRSTATTRSPLTDSLTVSG